MFDVYEAVDNLIEDINTDYYESCYDAIYEELCDRLECGELSLEEAEMINEAAAEKYLTEGNAFNKALNNTIDKRKKLDNRIKAYEKLAHSTYDKFSNSPAVWESNKKQAFRLYNAQKRDREKLEKMDKKLMGGRWHKFDPHDYRKVQDHINRKYAKKNMRHGNEAEEEMSKLRMLKRDWMYAHGDRGLRPEERYKAGRFLKAQQEINSKK